MTAFRAGRLNWRHRPKYWIPSAKMECAAFNVSMAVVAVMTHTLEAPVNPYKARKPDLWITPLTE